MLLQYNELYLFHRMFVLAAACIHSVQCSCEHYTEASIKAPVFEHRKQDPPDEA